MLFLMDRWVYDGEGGGGKTWLKGTALVSPTKFLRTNYLRPRSKKIQESHLSGNVVLLVEDSGS